MCDGHVELKYQQMKRFLLLTVMSFFMLGTALSQTSLEGTVTDASTGEALPFATVALYKNGVLTTGVDTDLDGNYFFSDIDPGTYDVEASFIGYTAQRQTGVILQAGRTNRLNFAISEGGVLLDAVEIVEYKVPLIEVDNTTSGATVTAEKIRSLPTKNINAIAATSAGISSTDGGDINVRGSRSDATVYYIDGIRVTGDNNLIPQTEIDQMQIITGGVEAKYGDLVGGAISITTKGPSNQFGGGVEVETSEYLDGYGYNLIVGNVSGPILKKDDGTSVLGFRFSGQYRNIKDNFPIAGGVYALSEEKINELEQEPVFTLGNTRFPSIERLEDAKLFHARPNDGLEDYSVTGKIDARISSAIDISFSGSYNNSKDQFAPNQAWRFANWTHNPFLYDQGYRGNVRFRHRIGRQSLDAPSDDENAAVSNIRNLFYTLQVGFERTNQRTEDPRLGDNYMQYGYYGNQARDWEVFFGQVDSTIYVGEPIDLGVLGTYGHIGYREVQGEFSPSQDINNVLGKYNNINGFLQSELNTAWGLYSNVGSVYNNVQKSENDIATINITSGFDFLPGGSRKGRHSIQFGFLYEQRTDRLWNLRPRDLWTLGRISINNHINGIDPDNVIRVDTAIVQGGVEVPYDVYGGLVSPSSDNLFYRKVRELTGNELYEYVNIDGIDPNNLTLDMFSAAELNNHTEGGAPILTYYGYDYLGNKLDGGYTFDDFFTSRDSETGVRTFVSPAFKPIYGAAYIQDKFSFKNLIVRAGVRMDYFDANTKVLKDPYSLYEIQSAREFFDQNPGNKPGSVGDDWKVYVEGEGSTQVVGYRSGDDWYAANGTSVSGGNVLFGGGLVHPAIKNPDAPNIKSENFDPNRSFKDYEAQLNVMPRVAFSFPISDEANFFAHYDVLYQRPSTNTNQTPVGYYYFERASGDLFNNPDLKPVRTVDYEVGFQQKLSNTTALKISAYYKEQKDLIQSRVYAYLPAPVNRYETYGNLDFATVKGFSFQFDRRRVGNLELTATYTLQFADGSGSDANSSRGINNRGIIRNLIPLTYDERHRITAVIDYRYGDKNYDGPMIGDVAIFKNAGVNFNLAAVSGRPYTQRQTVTQFGGTGYEGAINGSRMPWTFNVDMMVEKGFRLFNNDFFAYLRIQNLFDIRNVRAVFPYTGDPEDDGYLVSSFGRDALEQIDAQNRNTEAFLAAYNWRLDSFSNFTLPRRIYLGLRMDF